jgi:Zn-dependent protease
MDDAPIVPESREEREGQEQDIRRRRAELIRSGKKSSRNPVVVLVATLLLFLAVGGLGWGIEDLIILVGVLFLHEGGHALGMMFFGYRDVSIFFIPFFGAAAYGRKESAPAWQQAIVSLMGPLPGAIAGIVLITLNTMIWVEPLINKIGFFLLLINLFNMLPFMPFDGGHFFNHVLFSRNRHLESVFAAFGVVGLAATGYFLDFPLLYAVAFFALIAVPHTAKMRALTEEVRVGGVSDPRNVDDEMILKIDELVAQRFQMGDSERRVPIVQRILSYLGHKNAGAMASFALVGLYLLPFALGAASLFFMVRENVVPNLVAGYSVSGHELDWKEFRPEGEGFIVEFPGIPQTETIPMPTPFGMLQVKSHSVELMDAPVALAVQQGEIKNMSQDPAALLEENEKNGEDWRPYPTAKVYDVEKVTLSGHPGRKFRFEFSPADAPSVHINGHCRIYLTNKRLFRVIYARMKVGESKGIAERFFDSFRLVTQ